MTIRLEQFATLIGLEKERQQMPMRQAYLSPRGSRAARLPPDYLIGIPEKPGKIQYVGKPREPMQPMQEL